MAYKNITRKAFWFTLVLFPWLTNNAIALPVLSEVYPVPKSGNDDTPHYTFKSSQSGGIMYMGDCASVTRDASAGNNTINFNKLDEGIHSNCKIVVVTTDKTKSAPLSITPFTIDKTQPTLLEVSPIPEVTNDTTPSYAFSSSEEGKIIFEGDCYSKTGQAKEGTNIIVFNVMTPGTHSNCKISVKDEANNTSASLQLSSFSIDNSLATLKQKDEMPLYTNQNSPTFTFSSTKDGGLIYEGNCSSSLTAALSGDNSVVFNPLEDGWHKNCTISLKDNVNNISPPLVIPDFYVDTIIPEVKEVIAVEPISKNTQPQYTFSSSERGKITYGGGCTSKLDIAEQGTNAITFDTLPDGKYSSCTIEVADQASNISAQLAITPFVIDNTPPVLSVVTIISATTSDTSPNFTFSSNEEATIMYSGDCKSTDTNTSSGNKTVTFNSMSSGIHTNCKITLKDGAGNISPELIVPPFTVKGFTLPKLNTLK